MAQTYLQKAELKQKFNKIRQYLVVVCLISICFDAYSIVSMGTFPITLSVLCVSAYVILGVIELSYGIFPDKKQLCFYFTFLFIIFLSIVTSLEFFNLNSILLYIFFLTAYLFSKYDTKESDFFKKLKIIAIVYTLLSLYGIYQFIAYANHLPFSDFLLEGHMVSGFNRTNLIYIGERGFYRAHSIYLEPSTLSQFSAFAIILTFILYGKKILKLRYLIIFTIINLIAMLLSVAGTGIIMFGLAFVCLVVECFIKRKYLWFAIASVILIILAIVLVFTSEIEIFEYARTRILEIFDPKMSGGMRFSFPYFVSLYSALNRLFGYSPGNEYIANKMYLFANPNAGIDSYTTFASGYAKILAELGFLGFAALIYLIATLKKNGSCKYIFIFTLAINFVGGSLLQPYFWVFVFLLNHANKEGMIYERHHSCGREWNEALPAYSRNK